MIRSLLLALLCGAPAAGADERGPDGLRPDLAERIAPEVRHQGVEVAADQNGYAPLRLAAALVREPGLSARFSPCATEAQPSQIDTHAVEANALSLWLFDQAGAKPVFQWPSFQVGDESFHRYRQLFRLAITRARIEARDGPPRRAAGRLIAALSLARHMARGEAQLIHALVALWLERTLLDEILCVAAAVPEDADTLRQLLDAVAAAPPLCENYAQALRVELNTFWIPSIQELEESGDWHGPPLGEAVETASRKLAAHLASCGSPAGPSCPRPVSSEDIDPGAYDAVFWQSGAQRVATETILALRLYAARFRQLPSALEELVAAGILPSLPRDPFTGTALRYDAGGPSVWFDLPPSLDACRRSELGDRLTWGL